MLRYRLTHPEMLAALASAGHGARVLLADGHYPVSTESGPRARTVWLNLTAGTVRVTDVLEVLLDAVVVEAATVMTPPETEREPEVFTEFARLLPAGVAMDRMDRFGFYRAAGGSEVALVVATGDTRTYANLLLTLGVTGGG